MNHKLRYDAETIVKKAINTVKPDEAIRRALKNVKLTEKVYVVSVGKAAWQMAHAVTKYIDRPIYKGIVVTKYAHVMDEIPGFVYYTAGHPVPDTNSYLATQAVLDMTHNLTETDTVLFLLSGGGSALFEKPLVEPHILESVTNALLTGGANIREINTIRKRLSAVKGGRFAIHCAPARVESIILSDILGDPVDMIASGPTAADPVTVAEATAVAQKYCLDKISCIRNYLEIETPKSVPNVHTQVVGSVRELCKAAEQAALQMGYDCVFLSDCLDGYASVTGRWMIDKMKEYIGSGKKTALIAGGETVVHVTGNGLGGRNQELALAAAEELDGIPNAALISVGSDGTDGPTDAAGGYVDGDTIQELMQKGINSRDYLDNNDSYHALQAIGNLIITGPTGTNVNDVIIGLIEA